MDLTLRGTEEVGKGAAGQARTASEAIGTARDGVVVDGTVRVVQLVVTPLVYLFVAFLTLDLPVVLGIRPEHVRDRMELPDAPSDRVVTATVDVVEPLGSETLVHATLGSHPIVVRFEGRSSPSVQAPVDLVFDLSEAHLFDPKTEARIG